ncbi:MAG: PIN domain-containing protein [Chloroflexi bacterium]|nr:PIN domain-containing protein [Chloroflexota bacterium]
MTTSAPSVLIETSAWVRYLRRRDPVVQNAVAGLVQSGRAVVCGTVLTELIGGERNPVNQERVRSLLQAARHIEFDEETWFRAGVLLAYLRQRGAAIPTPDALIAALALQHGCALYTLDGHFQHVQDLQLYAP